MTAQQPKWAYQLIVGGVVHNIQDTSLPGGSLHMHTQSYIAHKPLYEDRRHGTGLAGFDKKLSMVHTASALVSSLPSCQSFMQQRRITSEPQEKLPESSLNALNLKLPPLTRTRLTVTFEDSLVLPG